MGVKQALSVLVDGALELLDLGVDALHRLLLALLLLVLEAARFGLLALLLLRLPIAQARELLYPGRQGRGDLRRVRGSARLAFCLSGVASRSETQRARHLFGVDPVLPDHALDDAQLALGIAADEVLFDRGPGLDERTGPVARRSHPLAPGCEEPIDGLVLLAEVGERRRLLRVIGLHRLVTVEEPFRVLGRLRFEVLETLLVGRAPIGGRLQPLRLRLLASLLGAFLDLAFARSLGLRFAFGREGAVAILSAIARGITRFARRGIVGGIAALLGEATARIARACRLPAFVASLDLAGRYLIERAGKFFCQGAGWLAFASALGVLDAHGDASLSVAQKKSRPREAGGECPERVSATSGTKERAMPRIWAPVLRASGAGVAP